MQKDIRKTDFWIRNRSQRSKAAPGKYEIPILSGRKDHYHGAASSFGRGGPRFEKQQKV
jgi:hypothetical protein